MKPISWFVAKFCLQLLFFVQIHHGQKECQNCKSNFSCLSSLNQVDCPEDEYLTPRGSFCGCCPGCIGGMAVGTSPCSNTDGHRRCAPGLVCNSKGFCDLDKLSCAYTYHLKKLLLLPTCETDGTFAAVQCKGDRVQGRCFCYSESGERIFGWSWWRDSTDMTCACSRLKNKMNQQGRNENTLHCDQKGNFEDLQCDNAVCWCADAKTGDIVRGSSIVPQAMWQTLSCYDITKTGPYQYLRQCESAAHAQNIIKKNFAIHGTTKAEFNNIACDFDGSYGNIIVENGIAACQWRDGSKITPYQVESNFINQVNCNCARDQKIFAQHGVQHILTCGGSGNYKPMQNINGKFFCVDRDGFIASPMLSSEQEDCSSYLYYETKEFEEEESTPDDDDDYENDYQNYDM